MKSKTTCLLNCLGKVTELKKNILLNIDQLLLLKFGNRKHTIEDFVYLYYIETFYEKNIKIKILKESCFNNTRGSLMWRPISVAQRAQLNGFNGSSSNLGSSGGRKKFVFYLFQQPFLFFLFFLIIFRNKRYGRNEQEKNWNKPKT